MARMLMESFVAIMALVAASTIEPGVYFAMNSPAAIIGTTAESAAQAISQWGFYVTPEMIAQTAKDVGEHTIISRTGGAPTLAVGMAQILSDVIGGKAMMAFWYHFAILFEALFILTAVDAGTRAGRFMLQDLLGTFVPSMKRTDSLAANLIATALCVAGWGYFLYQGVVDPLGGINTLWPLFGISNQMLAGIALILCTVRAVQDEARPFRLGHDRARHLGDGLHPDRRLAKDIRCQSAHRLSGACATNTANALADGTGAGAGQIHRADAAGHFQRLCQCVACRPVHAGADQHAGIWYQDSDLRARHARTQRQGGAIRIIARGSIAAAMTRIKKQRERKGDVPCQLKPGPRRAAGIIGIASIAIGARSYARACA